MLYQLPSGKVVYLSTEEFLSMSDQDLHDLTNSGAGDEPSQTMFYGNGKNSQKSTETTEEPQIPLDYDPNKDDAFTEGNSIDPNALPDS